MINQMQQDELATLINKALSKVENRLDLQDILDVREYVEHGEYGVGWELLWHLIKKHKLEVPKEVIVSGQKMSLNMIRRNNN